MMKSVFLGIITIHGLIHLLGFIKAYNIASITQLNQPISKPVGMLWLLVTVLFLTTAVLFFLKNDYWLGLGIITVVASQILIIMTWQDAKWGTIPNIIIALVLTLSMGSYLFEQSYGKDVVYNFTHNNTSKEEILTEKDMQHLPMTVQKYLQYVGVVGKPKVKNVFMVFEGQMREKDKDYFSFTCEQYSFMGEPTRLFFMKGKLSGITVPGYHKYMNKEAIMDIRLFGLLKVVYQAGVTMDQAETVTYFNDVCLMAPSSLIDERIQWEEIDDLSVKGTFTNGGISVSAILHFNNEGQLINFVSDDRIAVGDMKQYRFSTPVSEYKDFNGYNLPSHGEMIWHYPDGEFVYGKIQLKEIEYNLLKKSSRL